MLKYVSKNFGQFKNFDKNKNFYYCSKGLKRSESKVVYNCNDVWKNNEIMSHIMDILKLKNQSYSKNEFFFKVCFNSREELQNILSEVKIDV